MRTVKPYSFPLCALDKICSSTSSLFIVMNFSMALALNGDTECYLEIFQMVTLSVKLHNWIPSLSIEKP